MKKLVCVILSICLVLSLSPFVSANSTTLSSQTAMEKILSEYHIDALKNSVSEKTFLDPKEFPIQWHLSKKRQLIS